MMKIDLGIKPYIFPMPVLMIATYGENDKIDVMNAAWGNICAENMVSLNISEEHMTAKNIKKNKAFTISIAGIDHIKEADFFDPSISSKYGMTHLKFCLNTAGNEVSALAMYNAGTGRVRSNKTPQSTLNYVGKIISYQKMLDQLFSEQVSAYFETQLVPSISVAYAHN